MRTRAAYIRSFGTTGILVLAAVLLLGVVGALVGFHRWPDGAVGQTVPTVPVRPAQEPAFHLVRSTSVHKASTRHLVKTTSAPASAAGLVKVVPVSTPVSVGSPVTVAPGQVAPVSAPAPAAPQHPTSHRGHRSPPVTPAGPAPDVDPASLH